MADTIETPLGALEAAFLANRAALLRFLTARGAGDAAEDLLHEVWLKVSRATPAEPLGAPLAYLYRAANSVMIDRFRSEQQARQREQDWVESSQGTNPEASDAPSAERALIGHEQLEMVARALGALGPRAEAVFRRHRIDGLSQRLVAEEFGISVSTVESDLRVAYRAIADIRGRFDEE